MTQTSATSRWSYTGNAVTTTFAYTTRIFATTDLDVYLDGVLQASGYSVTGAGSNSGGNVVFTSAPGSGVVVVIVRDVPYTQETDLLDAGPAPMATIEDMVDKTTILTQQASDLIARSIRQPEADTTAIGRLPVKASRLGKLLRFNSTTGDPEAVAAADLDLATVTPFIGTLLDDTTAAAARTTLGAVASGDLAGYQPLDADLTAIAGLAGVRGDIIYRDATQWQRLAAGTSGQALLTQGAGANPQWGSAGLAAASQAEMEAASSNTVAVTPGRANFHPGVAKAWVYITISGGTVTVAASHNVSSVTDNAVGDYTTNFTTAFSSANYAWVAMGRRDTGNTNNYSLNTKGDTAPTASAHRWQAIVNTAELNDPPGACVAYFGDQ